MFGGTAWTRTTIRRLTAFRNDLYTTDPNKKSHRCNLRVTNGSLFAYDCSFAHGCQHNLCNMFNFMHTFTTIEGI